MTSRNIVKVTSIEEMARHLGELIHISVNLRYWQNYWHEHYGSIPRNNMKAWQTKMDAKLSSLGITDHLNTNAIRITLDGQSYTINYKSAKNGNNSIENEERP